jgi:hypothetical protein
MNPGEQRCEVRMSFRDGDSETLLVTPIGPNLCRMEESSVLGEVSYHDVIEAELQTDGTVRFLRLLTPSGLTTVSWILPQNQVESPALSVLLEKVMAAGGNWERIFGGILLLHLPPAESDRLVGEFNDLFDQLSSDTPRS